MIFSRSQSPSSHRRRAGLALTIGFAVFASGCAEEQVVVEDMLPSVAVHVLSPLDFDEEIHASGELKARFHTTIAAEVDGRVTELAVDEGGSVDSGAIVIELDPQRRQLDLAAAEARLAQARAKLRQQRSQTQRIRELRSQNVSSIQQLEEAETMLASAQSDVSAAQAAVGVAERAVADSSVTAPFAGIVARRAVELGEFVQKGTLLYELVALNPMEAIFSLTELDSERVRLGQTISIAVGAFPDRTFSGVVSFVSPTIDRATRTLRIKAQVDNADALLRPGLFARVSLGVAKRENVLMVPAESLLQRANGVSVYRVIGDDPAEGRVERVPVETGSQHGSLVEVRGDVRAGDRIVRRGHGGLADGMVVVVVEGQQAAVATGPENLRAERDS